MQNVLVFRRCILKYKGDESKHTFKWLNKKKSFIVYGVGRRMRGKEYREKTNVIKC